jgi:hypothetical protein
MMFDPVTDQVMRLRRLEGHLPSMDQEPAHKTRLVCHVCGREIGPEEELFWVDNEPHCFQCHSMLEYELDKERSIDTDVKERGTRWEGTGPEEKTE